MRESSLHELIAHYEDRGVAYEFCRRVLGTLVDYDRTHNADLLHTLRTYFSCNANAVETAERLFLHRNSLSYRIQRIESLLGVDLKDPQSRLALHLALEMTDLLRDFLPTKEHDQ